MCPDSENRTIHIESIFCQKKRLGFLISQHKIIGPMSIKSAARNRYLTRKRSPTHSRSKLPRTSLGRCFSSPVAQSTLESENINTRWSCGLSPPWNNKIRWTLQNCDEFITSQKELLLWRWQHDNISQKWNKLKFRARRSLCEETAGYAPCLLHEQTAPVLVDPW